MNNKNILMIAGEASGDLHGASLIRELKKLDGSLKIFGIGGDKMQAEGMELIYHIDKMAFLGFVEVIKHLPFIKKVQRDLILEVKKRNVKQVILIDYPGFNLSIAKKLKQLKLKSTLLPEVSGNSELVISKSATADSTEKSSPDTTKKISPSRPDYVSGQVGRNDSNDKSSTVSGNIHELNSAAADGLELIYYITPQVWAWGKSRVNKIRELFSKVLVVFPFEEKFFKEKNVNAEFVGHPLIQEMNRYNYLSREQLNKKFDLDPAKEILLILAGSRKQEVKSIFPESIKAATKLAVELDMQIVVACSSNLDEKVFYELTDLRNFKVIKEHTYDVMKNAKFGIVKSGTSTLEAGLLQLPMVIVYKTSWLTYLIGKLLVKINNIGMANIILEEHAVPELIQNGANADNIYNTALNILSDKNLMSQMKNKLSKIKDILGNKNAPQNAAKIIYSLMMIKE